jgi:hypothetical protein
MKRTFYLVHAESRRRAAQACLDAPEGYACTISEPTRNSEQNSRMWAALGDVSEQVVWYGKKLTPDDWKNVFSASLKRLDVVPNLDGSGFVALGMSTSRLSKREMADLITLIDAFGAEHNVHWSKETAEA